MEAEAEARASACGSPETMDGQPVYDASEGEETTSLLPQPQRRARRLRPAVGAAVACVAAFGAVAVVTNARTTELRRSNDPEIGNVGRRSAAKTPTIVISLLDDQGYADVPWHAQDAATQAAMPFADALRKDAGGVDVENYHTWRDCTPSRAMLLTGRHHAQLGMHVPLLAGATAALPTDENTIGELLEKARPGAYHKAIVGKWDLGAASPKYVPTARGFDAFTGFYNAMIDYFDWTIESVAMTDIAGTILDAQRNDGPAAKAAGQYTTRFLRDAALGEVAAAKTAGKALFLYAAWNAIHYDVAIPDAHALGQPVYTKALELGLTETRATALGALRIVDAANEWIYSRLDRDNTIWIQTSDNGGDPNQGASNYPLRGGKVSGWQGGFQVPCFVWLGANLRGSLKEYDGLVYVTDWVPTIIGGALGAPEALPDDLYGQDLWESLRGNSAKAREDILLMASYGTGDEAGEAMVSLRTNRYKVTIGQAPCAVGTPSGDYAGCDCSVDRTTVWVSDLLEDPSESTNLNCGDALPADVRADLSARLARSWDAHVEPAQRQCYDDALAAAFIQANCTYNEVQYYCPFLDEDVEDIPRYQAAVPRSARFNWLARAPDVCLGDADDAAFDPTCVQEEATVLLSLAPEEWEDYCHPGDAA